MNRRQLFGWLSALPFMPAALARPRVVEVGGGYARVAVTSSLASWAGGPITFPAPSAEWGTPVDFYLVDTGWPYPLDRHYKPNLPEWF